MSADILTDENPLASVDLWMNADFGMFAELEEWFLFVWCGGEREVGGVNGKWCSYPAAV